MMYEDTSDGAMYIHRVGQSGKTARGCGQNFHALHKYTNYPQGNANYKQICYGEPFYCWHVHLWQLKTNYPLCLFYELTRLNYYGEHEVTLFRYGFL